MHASKEECGKALGTVNNILAGRIVDIEGNLEPVAQFLTAAEKRLPTEEALARDKTRGRKSVAEVSKKRNTKG
jgi:hypothetical protein